MPPVGKEKDPALEADVLNGGGVRYDVRMGKYFGLVVAGVLLLTGCAAGEPEAATPSVTVTATPEATAAVKAAPLAAQPESAPAQEAPAEDPEAAFLGSMERNWIGELPSKDELLAAGNYACSQYDLGLGHSDFRSVQGDSNEALENNSLLNVNASRTLCPEHSTDT